MVKNVTKFFRNTPVKSIEEYFLLYPSKVSEAVNWNKPLNNIATPLIKAVDNLSDTELAVLRDNAERINEMTDEIGQSALMSVVKDEHLNHYHQLENEYARSTYIFVNDNDGFKRAEEIRYSDHYRKGSLWDGFEGPKGLTVSNKNSDIEEFKAKIADYFRVGGKVKVEIFEREKPYMDELELNITHIMVYREDLPKSYTALEDDDLVPKIIRPVIEIAITYEPESGQIEVIAKSKECREEIAKVFSSSLLNTKIGGEKVPLKQYEISKLLKQCDFPTDPEDGIDSVKVAMLKLKPYDSNNKVTLEVTAKEDKTIYEKSQEWFNINDPLRHGFQLSQVKLVIHFMPDQDNRRRKTIPINIRWPNGCDIKNKTKKERLIGDKYLKRWGLLKEI